MKASQGRIEGWIGPLALAAVLLAGATLPAGPRAWQWIVFAAMALSLWVAGSRLARRLAPDFGFESHAVAAFSLAAALAVVPATWLGHFGALRPGPFLLWTAVLALLSGLIPARIPVAEPATELEDRRERIYKALLLAAGLAVAFLGIYDLGRLRYAPAGPYGFDDTSYHLSAVANWIRHGDLRMIRFSMGDPSTPFYPVQGELASWVMIAPFRDSDVAGRWSQFPFAVFSFLAVAAIARRLGVRRRDAAFAAICYAGIFHVFPLLAIGAGNDHSTSFFTLAGLDAGLALAARRRPRTGEAALTGAALGQLLGTKYIGVLFAPPVLAVIALAWITGNDEEEERRSFVPALLALLATMVLVGGYTYARNWVTAGNPIFPAPVRLFGAEIFPGWEGVSVRDRGSAPEADIEVGRFLTRKSRLFGSYFPFTLLPAALLAPLLALWRRRWATAAVFLLAAVFFLEFLYLMHDHRDIRYFLPAVALAAVAFSWLLARSGSWTFYLRCLLLAWIAFQVPRYRLFGWPAALEIAVFLAFLGIGWLAARFALPRAWIARWGWIAAAAVLLLALPAGTLIERYQERKYSSLPSARALESLAGPRGARIAYAGMNQPYFYFGRRFQNAVEIVPRNRSLDDRFHEWGRPLNDINPYMAGPYRRWRGNLLRMGIGLVVIVRGEWEDPERRWMAKQTEDFQPLYQDDKVEIWKVLPDEIRPRRGYNPRNAQRPDAQRPKTQRPKAQRAAEDRR